MRRGGSIEVKKRARDPKGAPLEREACLTMASLCMSANLRRTERLVTRHYDTHLAGAGVTAVQLPILSAIATSDVPTLRRLTEQLGLDRSTLSRNLSVLRRLGLVEIGLSSGPKPGSISLTRMGRDRVSGSDTRCGRRRIGVRRCRRRGRAGQWRGVSAATAQRSRAADESALPRPRPMSRSGR